ncbi:hypothetical protein [Caldithrix abyssi]|uniref:Uncharacterized protein n=1 Tax=Caldithrix abyssi DSM 13497 TaxID=880073 RepID=H1XVJ5_CALAY|nr:hypothetical protein [Caldithrix abyssi]APF18936.1 hypothetical protein Cabys_2187 [Caldithrix abyssi DSM 13497]EHO42895.1 hypothetical protein Calab_3291 [Caldithrix abyssi DSM 13497]
MTRLEIIEIRTTGNNRDDLERFLKNWQAEVKAKVKTASVKIYQQAGLETDYSVHLRYDPDTTETEYRVLGERLVSDLKEFGLVNHTVWMEKNFL